VTSENSLRVAICICTFKRQELLRELLAGIAQLTFPKGRPLQIEIVVVDNDELASAKQICDSVSVLWPIKYVIEPRRGITYARNRAVAEVSAADFVAFIDDDEIPSVRWLNELLSIQAEFGADVVSGPVSPRYSATVPDWVKNGGFFDKPVSATGLTRRASTNNVLIGTHVLRNIGGFDHAFALSGGEDAHFFLRVLNAGYNIAWSPEALVFEAVSVQRGTIAWLLRREYQTGNGWVFCEASMDNRFRSWLLRFSKACGHIAIGSLEAVWWSVRLKKSAFVRSLQRVTLGFGMLAALAGHRFLAYQSASVKELRTLTSVTNRP
jgi:succinoglycan biosynthesis protein ExoM